MKRALFLPPLGELADPRALMDVAVAAEEQGWDGVFLWDHILRPETEPPEVADAWICLAAMAAVTTGVRLGPMVTPLARRRPQKVAREAATLDRLSRGRVVLGLGLGVDTGGELTRFGELTDTRRRGDLLDEGVRLVAALLDGERIAHRGDHFTAEGVRFLPRPDQARLPIWLAARGGAVRPVRRAARYGGLFPVDVDRDGLARMAELVATERGGLDGFDIAARVDADADLDAWSSAGATWIVRGLPPGATVADAHRLARETHR